MTRDHDFKKAVRARMEKTGESYVVARKQMLAIKEPRSSVNGGGTWHRLVATTREEAERILRRALEVEPRLTYAGLGVGDPYSRGYWMPGQGPGTPEIRKAFEEARAELWKHLEEIAACADWVRLQRPISSFNLSHHSYGYKHTVERWVEDHGGPHLYIANGSFIAAAVGMGFDARQTAPGSPNACFRFSRKTVKAAIQASGEAANNKASWLVP